MKITENRRKYDFICVKSFGVKIDKLSIEKCFTPFKILTPPLWTYKKSSKRSLAGPKLPREGGWFPPWILKSCNIWKGLKDKNLQKWKFFISVKVTSDKTCNRLVNVTDPQPGPLKSHWDQLRSHLMISLRGVYTG